MNTALLRPEVQAYLDLHTDTDIHRFILKGSPFEDVSIQELAQQLDGRRRIRHKLPLWYQTKGILFPAKLHLEQTSSEKTAQFKASLVQGETLFDGTGGFGIDSYYFSQRFTHITYAEQNETLSAFAKANFEKLKVDNIDFIASDSIDFLRNTPLSFDVLYFDPGRRDDAKGKVFNLADCQPNIPKHLPLLRSKSKALWIKTAPFLDITAAAQELQQVSRLFVIALDNEVKELLWCLDKSGPDSDYSISAVNLTKKAPQIYSFTKSEVERAAATYGPIATYLYEPNTSLLKAGAFQWISEFFTIDKLEKHTHLYSSDNFIAFPGRRFKVLQTFPFSKALKKRYAGKKYNVTTRNFPLKVAEIRKQLKIKDGGNSYLFFTTLEDQSLAVVECQKI